MTDETETETATVAEPKPPVAVAPSPVAVGVRRVTKTSGLVLPMVNTRASHFYFRRVSQLLRSMGKMRR
jgi:hypothetical protein